MKSTNNHCEKKDIYLGGVRERPGLRLGVTRRNVVAMLAAAPFLPAYAAKETSRDITFQWILRRKKMYTTLRRISVQDDEVKEKFIGLSHRHTTENYFRMIYDDPFKLELLGPLCVELVLASIDERVHPVEGIVSFVQSFPHCKTCDYQQWPTEVLFSRKADCSDKTTLACALIDMLSYNDSSDLSYWGMFLLPKIHLTLGLSSKVPGMSLHPEKLKIILKRADLQVERMHRTIHKDAVEIQGLRIHPDEAYIVEDGIKFYYTELNGDPGRLPGQWGSFTSADWKFIPARRT